MKPVKRHRFIFLLMIFLIALWLLYTLWTIGFFTTVHSSFQGNIQEIPLLAGAEDITIDSTRGIAFISADDRRARQKGDTLKGAIFMLNLHSNRPIPVDLTTHFQKDFHPHGISLFHTKNNRTLLFAVNHRFFPKKHTIEIFEFMNNSLIHLESIESSKLITSPNDVLAVGERSFYVTNDHGASNTLYKSMEDYLCLPWSYVSYYNGKEFYKAVSSLSYANGINMTRDGKTLFIGESTGMEIKVYHRHLLTGKLSFIRSIPMYAGVDNIEVDSQNNLWVGCHPNLWAFHVYSNHENKASPSQITKVQPTPVQLVTYPFRDNGKMLSGASVGAVYKNVLLIGSVYENKVLMCTMNQ